MSDFLVAVVAFVFVLGIMILVHEWGHFLAAKWFGVRVEIFSVGFGPRLWGRKRGDTDYRVSALPLGGYVKMAGDNPAEERSGAPDEFLSKPRWQRAIIAVAGPAMNVVLPVVLVAGMFLSVGIPYPAYLDSPAEVAALPRGYPAGEMGIRPGDRIVEIIGAKNPTWETCREQLAGLKAGGHLELILERGGERIQATTTVENPRDLFGTLGYPRMPAVVEFVSPGMPADRAGMKPGDEILAVNNQPVATWPQFVETLRASGGEVQHLLLRRGEGEVRVQVKPVQGQTASGPVWQIGILNRVEWAYRRPGFFLSISEAVLVNLETSRQIIRVVGQLFLGKASVRQMTGVIGIAQQSGQAARGGLIRLLELMAGISLNLAILNLLPIPILDGGHLLMLGIEGSLRRDLSLRVKERFVQAGLVFLLFIFVIVMYNDVVRLLPNR